MLRRLLKHTWLGRIVMIPARFLLIAVPYLWRQFVQMLGWAFTSKEHYNHTYHLTELNTQYLASYIAVVSGHPVAAIEGYMQELINDTALRQSLEQQALASPDRHNSDIEPRYGRRLGWYALIRATKPKVIVETGVDRGLGTAVMAAALHKNAGEGCPGVVYATDIVPTCGYLIAEPYKKYCRVLIGDSIESLKKFTEPVDIFLHDSDHRAEYEWAEFLAIEPRLHESSLVMSDNSQATNKLREFATRRGGAFLYFQDNPRDHWWPGDGIGTIFQLGKRSDYQIPKTI